MIEYDDFKKLLNYHNYIGGIDGLSETSDIPQDQTINQANGKYVIT